MNHCIRKSLTNSAAGILREISFHEHDDTMTRETIQYVVGKS